MRIFGFQRNDADTLDDEGSPDSFIKELNVQCNRIIIPASFMAAIAWLFYIPIDMQLHPDEPLILVLRAGLCVLGALILIAQFIPRLRGNGLPSLIILGFYLEVSTGILTGLSGGDPVYIGGFLFILMLIPMAPFPRAVQLGLTAAALASFFASGFFREMSFDSISASYSLLDIISATAISIVFTFILDGIRFKSWRRSKRIEIQEIEAVQGRLNVDNLLAHMLPAAVADELKVRGFTRPSYYKSATIVFMEFCELGRTIELIKPEGLVRELNRYHSRFDTIIERHGLEKLRAFSDLYMFAGGVPSASPTHAIDAVLAALEILSFARAEGGLIAGDPGPAWGLRIGISSGPVLAGIVGEKKFVYDVWGDPVYLAHDMMLASRSGSIRISSATHALLGEFFEMQAAGAVAAHQGDKVDSFIIIGIKKELSAEGEGLAPNEAFTARCEELKRRG